MNKKHKKKTFFYIYAVNWWQGVWSFGLRPFYLEWHWMACFCADVPLRTYSLSLPPSPSVEPRLYVNDLVNHCSMYSDVYTFAEDAKFFRHVIQP